MQKKVAHDFRYGPRIFSRKSLKWRCLSLYAPHRDNLRQDEALLNSSSFFAVEVNSGSSTTVSVCFILGEKLNSRWVEANSATVRNARKVDTPTFCWDLSNRRQLGACFYISQRPAIVFRPHKFNHFQSRWTGDYCTKLAGVTSQNTAFKMELSNFVEFFWFFSHWSTALVGICLLYKVPRSHSDTPHSVGPLWKSDRPVANNFTWQHISIARDRHHCPRRDSNPQSQQANGRWPTSLTL